MKKHTPLLLLLLALLLPACALRDYEEKAKYYFDNNALSPIEGIWISEGGGKFALQRNARNPFIYDVYRAKTINANGRWVDHWNYFGTAEENSTFRSCTIYPDPAMLSGYPFVLSFNYNYSKLVFARSFLKDVGFVKQYPKTNNYMPPTLRDSLLPSQGNGKMGTGVLLSSEGYIITCWHVVGEATTVEVSGFDNDFSRFYKAKVIDGSKETDLALLQIIDSTYRPIIPLVYNFKGELPDVGDDCLALGWPLPEKRGFEMKATEGIVNSLSLTDQDDYICIQAPGDQGNSGGPVFDKQGNLIGITTSGSSSGYSAAHYIIKTKYIEQLINRNPVCNITLPIATPYQGDLPGLIKRLRPNVCFVAVNLKGSDLDIPNRLKAPPPRPKAETILEFE